MNERTHPSFDAYVVPGTIRAAPRSGETEGKRTLFGNPNTYPPTLSHKEMTFDRLLLFLKNCSSLT